MKEPEEKFEKCVLSRHADERWTAIRVWRVYDTLAGIPSKGDPFPVFEQLIAEEPTQVPHKMSLLDTFRTPPQFIAVNYSMPSRDNYPIDKALASCGL